MKPINTDHLTRTLRLSLRPDTCWVANPELAARLCRIPQVLRVAVEADQQVVTLWFVAPAEDLLAAVHQTIRSYGCDIAAGRMS